MLPVPPQARANITEVHFLPFNPVDKRTAITYIDSGGNWSRVSKGAPEQVLPLPCWRSSSLYLISAADCHLSFNMGLNHLQCFRLLAMTQNI